MFGGMLFHTRASEYDKLLFNMFNVGFMGALLLAILYISFGLYMNIISSNV